MREQLVDESGMILGELPEESEGLGPMSGGGSVDEVNGEGALLAPTFVPTRAELVVLHRHWWRTVLLIDLFVQEPGGDMLRLGPFALRRMTRLEPFVDPEELAQTYVSGLVGIWGNRNEPLDVEKILGLPDDALDPEMLDPIYAEPSSHLGLRFRRWARPILDAVAAAIRHERASACERSAAYDEKERAFAALVAYFRNRREAASNAEP